MKKDAYIVLFKTTPDTVFPRHEIGTFTHLQMLQRGFTEDEIGRLLAGDVVRDHMADPTPEWERQLLMQELIDEHGRLTAEEIAAVEGCTIDAINKVVQRSRKKLSRDAELVAMLAELMHDEDEICIRTTLDFY